jgi:hypothetical protein
MRSLHLSLMVLVLLSVPVLGGASEHGVTAMAATCPDVSSSEPARDELARRGCCSHHKGVCGCNDSGRVICCDGVLSPSCRCKGGDPQAGAVAYADRAGDQGGPR